MNITIPENQVVELDVSPYPLSRLIVNTNVPTANITVLLLNGTVVATGQGRVTVFLLPGNYTVRALAPGYQANVTSVTLEPGQEVKINLTLRPIPPPAPPRPVPFYETTQFKIAILVGAIGAIGIGLWLRRRRVRVVEAEVEESGGGER